MKKDLPYSLIEAATADAVTAALVRSVDEVVVETNPAALASVVVVRGKLVLAVPACWESLALPVRIEMLRHEAAHVAYRHFSRYDALPDNLRDHPHAWQCATDAVIHHTAADPAVIESAFPDTQLVTFARLGLEPQPLLGAYLTLRQQSQQQPQFTPCAAGEEREHDDSESGDEHGAGAGDALERAAREIADALANDDRFIRASGAGQAGAAGRAALDAQDLPPSPPWVRKLKAHLHGATRRAPIPARSWRRFDRAGREWHPGRARPRQQKIQLFLDASGSIPDADLALALAAVRTLGRDIEVVVWSDHAKLLRNPTVAMVAAEIARHGGGTTPECAAPLRDPTALVVWISDGEVYGPVPAPVAQSEVWIVPAAAAHKFPRRIAK